MYKTASGAVTQALGRIEEVPIKVGEVQCSMTFMVVDTDSYDILLGLDLLIKIGAIVDVEQVLIQVRRGPGTDVEILPLSVVNLLQRSDKITDGHNSDAVRESRPENSDGIMQVSKQGTGDQGKVEELESDSDSSEDFDELDQSINPDASASEFEDTEFEELIKEEGPQQILQLTMQSKEEELIKEELADEDDYADWIQWAADEERRMQSVSEAAIAAEESVLL
jgi:hypothetical protein